MPLAKDIVGITRTFFREAWEEFDSMDHKLTKVAISLASFIATAVLWYMIFKPF